MARNVGVNIGVNTRRPAVAVTLKPNLWGASDISRWRTTCHLFETDTRCPRVGSWVNATLPSPEAARSEGGVAFCVRLCDGRYFPIQRHSGASSALTCSAFCPASATNIYTGNGIAHAVAPDGKRYSELATAFAYREKIIPGCTCNGRDAGGLVNTGVAEDPTLRPGDIIATNAGLMAYNGGTNGSTFTPISTYAGLSADLRRQLTETKIEPAAEGPAPMSYAEVASTRSTKNKRAQADR